MSVAELAALPQAVIVMSDPMTVAQRKQIVELAAWHRVPAIYALREFVEAGGLVAHCLIDVLVIYHAGDLNAYRPHHRLAEAEKRQSLQQVAESSQGALRNRSQDAVCSGGSLWRRREALQASGMDGCPRPEDGVKGRGRKD